MKGLAAIVFANQRYYAGKIVPVILICGLILTLPAASILLVDHIRELADKPLAALNTELILQHDRGGKEAGGVRTKGLMEPFNLHSFDPVSAGRKLAAIPGVGQFSTALVLWRFDPRNTLIVVGLNPAEPRVGFRKIEELIMGKGRFFSSSQAGEVLLERHFAKLFGYKPGTSFPLASRDLKIIGLVDFREQSNLSNAAVFLPYETALSLAGEKRQLINQVFLSLSSSADMQQVSRAIEQSFPGFSLISRDSLYKNLSAFNRLIYRGGYFLILAVVPLALVLLCWTLKIHRLEFKNQVDLLAVLGWPQSDIRKWRFLDTGYVLAGAILVAGIVTACLYWGALPHLRIAPLMNQGFSL